MAGEMERRPRPGLRSPNKGEEEGPHGGASSPSLPDLARLLRAAADATAEQRSWSGNVSARVFSSFSCYLGEVKLDICHV